MTQITLAILLLGFSSTSFAYLDPGSGSFMIQMLFASLLGAGVTLKMYYRSIKEKIGNFFCSKKACEAPMSDTPPNPEHKND